jgi:NTP pyrophosphatase (non-canonical NTP hydrolase)
MISKDDMVAFEYYNEDDEFLEILEEAVKEGRTKIRPSLMDMVEEFRSTAGQKKNPSTSVMLIKEEFQEWIEELNKLTSGSDAAELKELADLVYVIYGYANVMDWDLDEAIRRVHSSNMSRMIHDDGKIYHNRNGKVVKNPNAKRVALDDLV